MVTRYVRLGSAVAGVVAIVGLCVAGGALLVGRAALDGSAESVWTVVGLLLVVGAVGPPVLASFRLYSVGKWTGQLVGEFQSLIDKGGEASAVVIETTESSGGGGSQTLVTTAMPNVGRLRTQAVQSGTATRLSRILETLMTLPLLLAFSLIAMLFSAGAGFILLLIWMF